MRLPIHDLARPKAAAKRLAALSPDILLSTAQEALARSIGYKDWHELQSFAGQSCGPAETFDLVRAVPVIGRVADALALDPGEVQYALASSRMFGPIRIGDHLAIRSSLWRRTLGPPARNKPGTVVRDTAHGPKGEPGYLCQPGRPTRVLFDKGPALRGDFEVSTPRIPLPDFIPSRLWLPYGFWRLRDGSEVLYARDYLPLWRINEGQVERLEPWLWVETIDSSVNFASAMGRSDWASRDVREVVLDHLEDHGVRGLPILVEAMRYLLEPGVGHVGGAAHRLWLRRGSPEVGRPGMSFNDGLAHHLDDDD
jgi:hypothetical protein